MKIDKSNSAFPQPITYDPEGRRDFPFEYGVAGMSLRQYFAGQILAGIASDTSWDVKTARMIWDFADAMLKTEFEEGDSFDDQS